MTHEALETYLGAIRNYLAVLPGADEILAEIRSHILEKTETEFGEISEEGLSRTISDYGTPRAVAEQYLEGTQIISSAFKRHLFRYTAILFGFHLIIVALAVAFHASVYVIPFFYVPRMPAWGALLYVPMAFVYDFGLVALFLYWVTRAGKDTRLPWPRALRRAPSRAGLRQPRRAVLLLRVTWFAVLLVCFLRYQTVFFYTVNFGRPHSLLDPSASVFYSILVLAAFASEICFYALRFASNSAALRLSRDLVILFLLWVAWNFPVRPHWTPIPGFDTQRVGTILVIVLIAGFFVRFLRDLALVTRQRPSIDTRPSIDPRTS